MELTPQERDEAIHSLRRYFAEDLDQELGDLRARLLLDFIVRELLPLGYVRGVRDAEAFLRRQLEDLPATCDEPAFTYWSSKRKR